MLGIIGGTGLYAMPGLEARHSHRVQTPFGDPSAPLVHGTLAGRAVVFLARHGLEHQFLPGEINFRANIWALKDAGVRTIIASRRWAACARTSARVSCRWFPSTWTSPGAPARRASSAPGSSPTSRPHTRRAR
ncbi:MAG TPA: hypothetical protein VGF35_08240 [Steroidobacteraceae bacterium]